MRNQKILLVHITASIIQKWNEKNANKYQYSLYMRFKLWSIWSNVSYLNLVNRLWVILDLTYSDKIPNIKIYLLQLRLLSFFHIIVSFLFLIIPTIVLIYFLKLILKISYFGRQILFLKYLQSFPNFHQYFSNKLLITFYLLYHTIHVVNFFDFIRYYIYTTYHSLVHKGTFIVPTCTLLKSIPH